MSVGERGGVGVDCFRSLNFCRTSKGGVTHLTSGRPFARRYLEYVDLKDPGIVSSDMAAKW